MNKEENEFFVEVLDEESSIEIKNEISTEISFEKCSTETTNSSSVEVLDEECSMTNESFWSIKEEDSNIIKDDERSILVNIFDDKHKENYAYKEDYFYCHYNDDFEEILLN